MSLRAFVTNGQQGRNYGKGTWHQPVLVFGAQGDGFLGVY